VEIDDMKLIRRSMLLLTSGCLATVLCTGQPLTLSPKFEVASVKRLPPGQLGRNSVEFRPDGIEADGAYMLKLISAAYEIPMECIEGDAEALGRGVIRPGGTPVYNVSAKALGPVSVATLRVMLRRLLEERFDLKFHLRTHPEEVTALIVANEGLKIKPIETAPTMAGGFRIVGGGVEGKGSFDSLASILSLYLRPRVVNLTGLDGMYEISIRKQDPSNFLSMDRDEAQGRTRAALRAFGLDLTRKKIETKYFVVESILTTPVPN
jgi:uncharacterized protein (TIGR03435 family)